MDIDVRKIVDDAMEVGRVNKINGAIAIDGETDSDDAMEDSEDEEGMELATNHKALTDIKREYPAYYWQF